MKTWTTKNNISIFHVSGIFFKSYLLFNGATYILIDTGRKFAWNHLKHRLENLGVNNGNLLALILTHTHFDHAENAARIKEAFGAKIIVHESESCYLERGDSPLPSGTVLFTRLLIDAFRNKAQLFFRYAPVNADIKVGEGLDLDQFGFNAFILHTPGHTKGSMSVIIDDEVAFTGDNMVGSAISSIFPPFGNDIPGIISSWKRLLDTGCSLYIPAHGTPKKRAVLQRYYNRMKEKQKSK